MSYGENGLFSLCGLSVSFWQLSRWAMAWSFEHLSMAALAWFHETWNGQIIPFHTCPDNNDSTTWDSSAGFGLQHNGQHRLHIDLPFPDPKKMGVYFRLPIRMFVYLPDSKKMGLYYRFVDASKYHKYCLVYWYISDSCVILDTMLVKPIPCWLSFVLFSPN